MLEVWRGAARLELAGRRLELAELISTLARLEEELQILGDRPVRADCDIVLGWVRELHGSAQSVLEAAFAVADARALHAARSRRADIAATEAAAAAVGAGGLEERQVRPRLPLEEE